MKIVVTGGTGFIGSNLLAALNNGEHEILAIVRNKEEALCSSNSIEWVEEDLSALDWDPVGHLPSQVDAVIHLAQSKLYRDFPESATDIYSVNTAATYKLLDYGQKAGATHFIYASSGSVYNGIGKMPLSESGVIDPIDFSASPLGFYCASKLCSETLVEAYRNQYESTASLRIFAPYGQGGESALVNRLVNRVKTGESIDIQGNPGLAMNPIHVDDITHIIGMLLEKRDHTGLLNVAGKEDVSLTDIVKIAGEACGVEPIINYHSTDTEAGGTLIADIQKLRELSMEPRVPMREGISAIVNTTDENGGG